MTSETAVKTAIFTGSGIGLATAKWLHGMGMAVVAWGDNGKPATLAAAIGNPERHAQ